MVSSKMITPHFRTQVVSNLYSKINNLKRLNDRDSHTI